MLGARSHSAAWPPKADESQSHNTFKMPLPRLTEELHHDSFLGAVYLFNLQKLVSLRDLKYSISQNW